MDNPRKWPQGENRVTLNIEPIVNKVVKRGVLLHPYECELIYHLASWGGDCANLGHGWSASLMARAMSDHKLEGKVYTVDIFRGAGQTVTAWQERTRSVFPEIADRIIYYAGTTNDIGNKLLQENKKFNLLFIDADHAYEAVKQDFLTWSQMVQPNGICCFHDTNQDFSHRAIEEVVNWTEIKSLHVKTIRVFRKES